MGLPVEASAVLTHAGAFAMLKGAMAMAAELQVPASIAVVDARGHLLAFLRLDGAGAASQPGAIQKAVDAATGRERQDGGGLPVRAGGRVVGGIGVESGSAASDATLARAGLACLQTPTGVR
jgi:glc operon protein GlcG